MEEKMTTQQLMDENERLKEALQKIIQMTELKPIPDTMDEIYYNRDRREFMARRLGRIYGIAEITLNHCDG